MGVVIVVVTGVKQSQLLAFRLRLEFDKKNKKNIKDLLDVESYVKQKGLL